LHAQLGGDIDPFVTRLGGGVGAKLVVPAVGGARRRTWSCLLAVQITLLAANVSMAASSETTESAIEAQAQARLRAGLDLYRQERYREALAEFQAGLSLVPSPNLRFNVGLAHWRLGQLDEAVDSFEAVAADATARPALRDEAGRHAAVLTKTFARLRLVVPVPPNTARPSLRVDGRDYGQLDQSDRGGYAAKVLRLSAGQHRISVDATGMTTWSEQALLRTGEETTLSVMWPEPERHEPAPSSRSRLGWWIGGAAVLVSAAALTLWLIFRDNCDATVCMSVDTMSLLR
jgi:hypothetical protein